MYDIGSNRITPEVFCSKLERTEQNSKLCITMNEVQMSINNSAPK